MLTLAYCLAAAFALCNGVSIHRISDDEWDFEFDTVLVGMAIFCLIAATL